MADVKDRLVSSDRAVARLSVVTLLVALGAGIYGAVSTMLFTRPGAMTTASFGLALSIAGIVGALGAPLSGVIVDRLGARRISVVFTLLQAASMFFYPWASSFLAFLPLALVFMVASQSGSTARGALVASVVPPSQRAEARGYTFAAANIGVAVGGLVGAVFASFGSYEVLRVALLIDGLLLVLAALAVAKIGRATVARNGVDVTVEGVKLSTVGIDDRGDRSGRSFALSAIAAVFVGILSVNIPVISLAIPILSVKILEMGAYWVGIWSAVTTLAIAAVHIRISRRAEGRGAAVVSIAGGGALLIATLLLGAVYWIDEISYSGNVVLITLASVLVGVGGSAVAAATWSASYLLAGDRAIGRNQGLFNGAVGIGAAVAPLVLVYISQRSDGLGWPAVGAVFVASALILAATVHLHYSKAR